MCHDIDIKCITSITRDKIADEVILLFYFNIEYTFIGRNNISKILTKFLNLKCMYSYVKYQFLNILKKYNVII